MCGLCGFVGRGDRDTLKSMADAIEHRGPDSAGYWVDESKGIYLGHRRLSILDIAGGVQPMFTKDGEIGVIFNGEIYNHEILRAELISLGCRFETDHSDTEVLLHGWREWGESMPARMNGMWSFVIYDKRKEILFVSRDRFGKKPFYYSRIESGIAFSSEIYSIRLHPDVKDSIDDLAIAKLFAYGWVPHPLTMFSGISKLPGGHNLIFDLKSGKIEISRYWEFLLEPEEPAGDDKTYEAETGEKLRTTIKAAVDRRLMSDVPLGIFLSGGIDSSSISAFAVDLVGREKLHTFSVGFEEESFDETPYSSLMAKRLGTIHNHFTLSLSEAKREWPSVAERWDEPICDSSMLPTYLLCRETRKHVTVALGGDGADELFAGYDPFRALSMAEYYSSVVPRPVHKAVALLAGLLPTSHSNISFDFKVKRTLAGLSHDKRLWNPVWLGPVAGARAAEILGRNFTDEEIYSEAIELWDRYPGLSLIDQTLQFFTRLYMQDDILVKVDRSSMLNSLEVRAPYLDIELVDLARKIPSRFKLKNNKTKYILKKALEPVLPHEVIYRPKKGFGSPVGRWLKQDELGFRTDRIPSKLSKSIIEKDLSEHRTGSVDHRFELLTVWLLSHYSLPGKQID